MKKVNEVEEKGTLGALNLGECIVRLAVTMPMTFAAVYFNWLFLLPVLAYLVTTVCIDYCPIEYFVKKTFYSMKMPKVHPSKMNRGVSHAH